MSAHDSDSVPLRQHDYVAWAGSTASSTDPPSNPFGIEELQDIPPGGGELEASGMSAAAAEYAENSDDEYKAAAAAAADEEAGDGEYGDEEYGGEEQQAAGETAAAKEGVAGWWAAQTRNTQMLVVVATVVVLLILLLLFVLLLTRYLLAPTSSGRTRYYYLSAEEIEWDFAAGAAANGVSGQAFTAAERAYIDVATTPVGARQLGSVVRKARFRAYTSDKYDELASGDDDEPRLVGPILRAVVNDELEVTLRNRLSFAVNLFPTGLEPLSDSAAEQLSNGRLGRAVEPGATVTYRWRVSSTSGPSTHDLTSVCWTYTSTVTDEVGHVHAGLIGPLVVTAYGKDDAEASPDDTNRELFAMFHTFNEVRSPYWQHNVQTLLGVDNATAAAEEDPHLVATSQRSSINGFIYGTAPAKVQLKAYTDDNTRWYVMSYGAEIVYARWIGASINDGGNRRDHVDIRTGGVAVDMIATKKGEFLLLADQAELADAGMVTKFVVSDAD